jgi:serine/threonine protein kinase
MGARVEVGDQIAGKYPKLRAASAEELTTLGRMIGTPLYMPPEQMRGARDIDARADIWALGVVLYVLLTDHYPFETGDPVELIARVLMAMGPPDPPSQHRPTLPPALEALILRCLERDRERRPRSVGELARALEPFAPAAVLGVTTVAFSCRNSINVRQQAAPHPGPPVERQAAAAAPLVASIPEVRTSEPTPIVVEPAPPAASVVLPTVASASATSCARKPPPRRRRRPSRARRRSARASSASTTTSRGRRRRSGSRAATRSTGCSSGAASISSGCAAKRADPGPPAHRRAVCAARAGNIPELESKAARHGACPFERRY